MDLTTATEVKNAFMYLEGEIYKDVSRIVNVFISCKDYHKLNSHIRLRIYNNNEIPSLPFDYLNEDLEVYIQLNNTENP